MSPARLGRTPEQKTNYFVGEIQSVLGNSAFVTPREHVNYPGSNSPEGPNTLFDVIVARSQSDYNAGNFATFTMGWDKDQPIISTKETYEVTTPGVIPFREKAQGTNRLYNFGSPDSPKNYLNPEEHIALLLKSAAGHKGNLQENVTSAFGIGGQVEVGGSQIWLPGIKTPLANETAPAQRNNLYNSILLAPQHGVQDSRVKPEWNIGGKAIDDIVRLANGGRIANLPTSTYAVDRAGQEPVLVSPGTVGFLNPQTQKWVGPVGDASSAVKFNARSNNPLFEVAGNKATTLRNPNYHPANAILREGDVNPPLLHMRTGYLLDEFNMQSGTGIFQLPGGPTSGTVMGGYKTQREIDLHGVATPQDLFYKDENGKMQLRIDVTPRFQINSLRNSNVLKANKTYAFANILSESGGQLSSEALTVPTGSRRFAVTGLKLQIPEAWLQDPTQQSFVHETLLPALQAQGIGLDYRGQAKGDTGYTPTLSVGMVGLESVADKGAGSVKVTGLPIARGHVGVNLPNAQGVLRNTNPLDAIVPAKSPFTMVMNIFTGATTEQQINMLLDTRSSKQDQEAIRGYYSGLNGNPAVLEDIASAIGSDPWTITSQIKEKVLGSGRLYQGGNTPINQNELARQRANVSRYGFGREVGWIPFNTFTDTTKQQWIDTQIQTMTKQGYSKEEIQQAIATNYKFQKDKTLKDGTNVYTGFETREIVYAPNAPHNFVTEWNGVSRDEYDTLAEDLAPLYPEASQYLTDNPAVRGRTESSIDQMFISRAATINGVGDSKNYISVSGKVPTNIEKRVISQSQLSSMVSSLSGKYKTNAQVLSKLGESLKEMFGGNFGLRFQAPQGEGDVFLPSTDVIQNLDELGTELEPGAAEMFSVGKLSDKMLSAIRGMTSGDDTVFSMSREQVMEAQDKYARNISKVETGVHITNSASGLVEPGTMYAESDLASRMGMTPEEEKLGGLSTIVRQPQPTKGSVTLDENGNEVAVPGSTSLNVITTKRTNEVGRYISKLRKQSGFKGAPGIFNSMDRARNEDFDADPAQLKRIPVIDMLTKTLGHVPSNQEINAYYEKVKSIQSPEAQDRAMNLTYNGVDRETFDPLMKNIKANMGLHLGNPSKGLLDKSLVTDIGTGIGDLVNANNQAKKVEMARTHNQLKRRLEDANTSQNQPTSYSHEGVDQLAGKYVQSAVDKQPSDDVLSKILVGSFLQANIPPSKNQDQKSIPPTGLKINFNAGTENETRFETIGYLNKNRGPADVVTDVAQYLLTNQSSLTAGNFATLLGQLPKEYQTKEGLSVAENNRRGIEGLKWKRGLENELQGMVDDPTQAYSILSRLKQEGKIGENSTLGAALFGRLVEKQENDANSPYEQDRGKASWLQSIGNSFMDFDTFTNKYSVPENLLRIHKGNKNESGVSTFKNPNEFAKIAQGWLETGVQGTARVKAIMGDLGRQLGFSFEKDSGNTTYLYHKETDTQIRSKADLAKFENAVYHQTVQGDQGVSNIEASKIKEDMSSTLDQNGQSVPVGSGGNSSSGNPPLPPTTPPASGSTGSNRRNFWEKPRTQDEIDRDVEGFISDINGAITPNQAGATKINALTNLGVILSKQNNLIQFSPETKQTIQGESPIRAYKTGIMASNKEAIDWIIRTNPDLRKSIGTVNRIRNKSEGVKDFIPQTPENEIPLLVARAYGGNDVDAYNQLKIKAPELLDALQMSGEGIKTTGSKEPPSFSPGYIGNLNSATEAYNQARIQHNLTGSEEDRQRMMLAEAKMQQAQAVIPGNKLASVEQALNVPFDERVTTASSSAEMVNRKNALLSKQGVGAEFGKSGLVFAERAIKLTQSSELTTSEAGSAKIKADIRGEHIGAIETEALVDSTEKIKKFGENLEKTTGLFKDLHKAQQEHLEVVKTQVETAKKAQEVASKDIRKDFAGLISPTGGLLTEEEQKTIARLGGVAGQSAIKDYVGYQNIQNKAQGDLESSSTTARLGGAARRMLGGFGLMYMRSVAGIIQQGGEFGYPESVQIGNEVSNIAAQSMGATGTDQWASNISSAKAMYGGGGKRYMDKIYNNILRNQPALVDAGNGLISGIGAFGATEWLGSMLGPSIGLSAAETTSLFGPIGLGIGATVALGSIAVNQLGRLDDQTAWVAANYKGYQKAYSSNTDDWMTPEALNFSFANLFPIAEKDFGFVNEDTKKLAQNEYLAGIAAEIDANIEPGGEPAGKITVGGVEVQGNNAGQLTKPGRTRESQLQPSKLTGSSRYSEDEKAALRKMWIYQYVTSDNPTVSQEGRSSAASWWTQHGHSTIELNDYDLLNRAAMNYDAGIDTSTLATNILTATNSLYTATPGQTRSLFEAVNAKGITPLDLQQAAGITSFAEKMGVGWIQQNLGQTSDQFVSSILQNGKATPLSTKLFSSLNGPDTNATQAWLANQKIMQSFGVSMPLTSMPAEYANATRTQAQIRADETKANYTLATTQTIANLGTATGMDVSRMGAYWNSLVTSGTNLQQSQYANLMSNPTPMRIGAMISQMSPRYQNTFFGTTQATIGGNVSQEWAGFTGVNQNGQVNGLSFGAASLASPGRTAQYNAARIWGSDWQTNGGNAQPAMNAMVNGFTYNGQTYYGQDALEFQQNQQSYKSAMASAGVAMRQIAVTGAFTTGVGLGAYANTINPQTGRSFGINTSSGGFWGIEDQQRNLSRAQQAYSFQNQQASMDMSNKFWSQDQALQKQQMTQSRSFTQQNWAMQSNVRDLQWGWQQQDFQENVRFMTGRDRRLAERQEKRETQMHDLEGDQIELQKKQQKEMWKLEDQRFTISKQQHVEQVKFQEEELKKAKEFYAQQNKLEDQSTLLQRAYFVEQQKLQKESAGIQASAAKTQYDMNNKMQEYKVFVERANGQQTLLNDSLSTMVGVLKNLVDIMKNMKDNSYSAPNVERIAPAPTVLTYGQYTYTRTGNTIKVYLNGREVVSALENMIANEILGR